MIDYNTSNIIIAYYPPNAGGKFLLNCIGLSQGVVLQDSDLATKQLDGQLSSDDKFHLLLERLDYTKNIEKQWADFYLGCFQLFGKDYNPDKIPSDIINRLISSDMLFPIVAHGINALNSLSKRWPNAKIIRLVNETNFIKIMRPAYYHDTIQWYQDNISHLQISWNNIRDNSWHELPPTSLTEYYNLPSFIIEEDHNMHNDVILKLVQDYEHGQTKLIHNSVEWNCDWFLNSNTFVQEIINLYSHFNLTDIDQNKVKVFHQKWLECLMTLRDLE